MELPVTFPCPEIPTHGPHAKLLGIYPQLQEGLYLQRIRCPLGQPSPSQWRALADIARQFTPSAPLHLTTRQDVELHDLTATTLPQAQKALAEAGLSGFASAGDTVRNMTICSCSGLRGGRADLTGLAEAIAKDLQELEEVYSLPRKFKVSLSACPKACGLPYINDIGLVLDGDKFLVVVAGSLGARPGTGIVFQPDLPPSDVLPFVRGVVRFFAKHGDREHRATARLRHVRQKMGDEAFLAALREAVQDERNSHNDPAVTIPLVRSAFAARVTLTFPNGDLPPEAAEALTEITSETDFAARIAIHHQVAVFGPSKEAIHARLEKLPPLRQAAVPQLVIVACPGNRWCSRGLANTNAMADLIRSQPLQYGPHHRICISGCPNGCAHSAVADIGLLGGRTTIDGQSAECFTLMSGGGRGRTQELAKPVAQKLAPAQVLQKLQ